MSNEESTRATTAPADQIKHKRSCFTYDSLSPIAHCTCGADLANLARQNKERAAVPVPDNTGRTADKIIADATRKLTAKFYGGGIKSSLEIAALWNLTKDADAAREPAPVARDLPEGWETRTAFRPGGYCETKDAMASMQAEIKEWRARFGGAGVARDLDVEAETIDGPAFEQALYAYVRGLTGSENIAKYGEARRTFVAFIDSWGKSRAARGSGDKANSAPPAPDSAVLDAASLAWDTALADVAFYVAGHCADGEHHAEIIMGMPMPKMTINRAPSAGSAGTHTEEST